MPSGSARMVYQTSRRSRRALADTGGAPHVVVVADLDERVAPGVIAGATILEVGSGGDGTPLTIRHADEARSADVSPTKWMP